MTSSGWLLHACDKRGVHLPAYRVPLKSRPRRPVQGHGGVFTGRLYSHDAHMPMFPKFWLSSNLSG